MKFHFYEVHPPVDPEKTNGFVLINYASIVLAKSLKYAIEN